MDCWSEILLLWLIFGCNILVLASVCLRMHLLKGGKLKVHCLSIIPPTVSPDPAFWLERLIQLEECFEALSHMGKDKSPGWDGLTVEFFLHFWKKMAPSVLTTINQAGLHGQLEFAIKQGLIKLIPKQFDASSLNHWRPISMMPVIYKILAKVVASRLQ